MPRHPEITPGSTPRSIGRSIGRSTGRAAAAVPVIDIAPFHENADDNDTTGRDQVASAVTSACEEIGFLIVTGHGVAPDLIAAYFDVAHGFFEQPLAVKRQVRSPVDNVRQGYAHPGLARGDHRSERQSYNVHRYDTAAEAIAHGYPADVGEVMLDALWPAHPPAFRQVVRAYMAEMEALANRLLRLLEHGLGLPSGWFAEHVDRHTSTQVMNYYCDEFDMSVIDPTQERSPFRFKAHVDGDIFTILYQDDGPGCLQLHQRGHGWRDVLAVEDTFVVNIGELMSRWTNDRFVATPHRVLRPAPDAAERPRISSPFFLKPDMDSVIAPIPELIPPGDEPHYEPVEGRAWLIREREDNYAGNDSTKRFALAAAVQEAP